MRMETNLTTAHPFLMANDLYRDGDVANIYSAEKHTPIKVWAFAHRSDKWNQDWHIGGGCFYTSKDAALRSASRLIRNNPSLWEREEFTAVQISYFPH